MKDFRGESFYFLCFVSDLNMNIIPGVAGVHLAHARDDRAGRWNSSDFVSSDSEDHNIAPVELDNIAFHPSCSFCVCGPLYHNSKCYNMNETLCNCETMNPVVFFLINPSLVY